MHAKNMQMIADLKRQGIDTTELEKVLNATPGIDSYIGQGITRTQEFTTIVGEKRRLEAQFTEVQSQLAAMQNQLKGGNLNPATITAIDTRMKALKQFLIDEDYPESQVNELFKDIEGNIAASQTPNSPSNVQPQAQTSNQQKGVAMTDEERNALRNESAAVGAALGVGLNFKIQRAIVEFNEVYKRYPNAQEMANLENAVTTRHIQGGETLDNVVDDIFKISAQRQANETAARAAEIEAAKQAGRAEAYQEAGIIPGGRPQGGRIVSKAPISRHFAGNTNNTGINNGIRNAPVANTNIPNPDSQNPPQTPNPANTSQNPNQLLPYQQRGSKASRMQHLATVVAENPDIYQNDGYQPSYNRNSEQQQ